MKKKVIIEFSMDNSSFEDYGAAKEMGAIVQRAANKIRTGLTKGPVLDTNGNTVGSFNITNTRRPNKTNSGWFYVLVGRCGTEITRVIGSLDLKEVQKIMKLSYKSALEDEYNEVEEGSFCELMEARVVTSGDWYEWFIKPFNLAEISGESVVDRCA